MMNVKALSILLLTLAFLFVSNSSARVVDDFCNSRNRDKKFCLKVLKSDPRTASAKNNTDLLYISVDLAVGKTNETREFLAGLEKKGPRPLPPLKAALKDCVSAYDLGLVELKIIPAEVKEDPMSASYDAFLAVDAFNDCQRSLERNKIKDSSISMKNKVTTAYAFLVYDIADSLD